MIPLEIVSETNVLYDASGISGEAFLADTCEYDGFRMGHVLPLAVSNSETLPMACASPAE